MYNGVLPGFSLQCNSLFQELYALHFCAGCVELSPPLSMFQELTLLEYIVLTSQLRTMHDLVMPMQLATLASSSHSGTHKEEAGSPSSTAR